MKPFYKIDRKMPIVELKSNPKFSELFLISLDEGNHSGSVEVWNLHLQSSPEYSFKAQSLVSAAMFSKFHPNILIGGCESGQLVIWDNRSGLSPCLKTAMNCSAHTQPITKLNIIGIHIANEKELKMLIH